MTTAIKSLDIQYKWQRLRWFIGRYDEATKTLIFSAGFLCGMIATDVATHVYRNNI